MTCLNFSVYKLMLSVPKMSIGFEFMESLNLSEINGSLKTGFSNMNLESAGIPRLGT